jgi:DNA-binding beta-propeller fold protein YncE
VVRTHPRSSLLLALAAALALAAGGVWASPGAAGSGTVEDEYVVNGSLVAVYNINDLQAAPQTFSLPFSGPPQGIEASPSGVLYVAYGGEGGGDGTGSIIAYDLVTHAVLWNHHYPTGVDSIAITPDDKTLFVPVGEESGQPTWLVVDAASGALVGRLRGGFGAHDTCVGADGKRVYLGGVDTPYLTVASTASDAVVARIGPLHGPGVRPFAISHAQTYAFTTAVSFLGFQVSSLTTDRVLYSVAPPGFHFDPATFPHTPDHGISISPDDRQLYLLDTPNGYLHVFDLSGLPGSAPRDVADIKLRHPPADDSWLEHSLDGRYVFVGDSGDVVNTASHTVVAYLPELSQTSEFLEIDWRNGRPVAAGERCS